MLFLQFLGGTVNVNSAFIESTCSLYFPGDWQRGTRYNSKPMCYDFGECQHNEAMKLDLKPHTLARQLWCDYFSKKLNEMNQSLCLKYQGTQA